MQHIERWKGLVRAARAWRERHERDAYWDEKRAAWFNRFAGQSDRSDTYRLFRRHVRGRVLEVGPGPGAYTRHLLPDADEVVAVEPSAAMIARLRENVGRPPNLVVIESSIEDYIPRLERYQFALAANVLSGIERIDEVLAALAAHAEVVGIVMWSNAKTPGWSHAVYREVLGRWDTRPDSPGNEDLLGVLTELGLDYEAHPIVTDVHTFGSRSDVVDWVEGFLSVPPERRGDLERVLEGYISEKDGKFGLPSNRVTQVVLARKRSSDG